MSVCVCVCVCVCLSKGIIGLASIDFQGLWPLMKFVGDVDVVRGEDVRMRCGSLVIGYV